MNKTFYKVVRNNPGGEYLSCVTEDNWSIEYPIGKWVRGVDNTPIFVFRELETARRFSRNNPCGKAGNSVFACLVKKPRRFSGLLCYFFEDSSFFNFWRAKKAKKSLHKLFDNGFGLYSAPYDSWAVDSVKLVKDVTYEQ